MITTCKDVKVGLVMDEEYYDVFVIERLDGEKRDGAHLMPVCFGTIEEAHKFAEWYRKAEHDTAPYVYHGVKMRKFDTEKNALVYG